MVPDRPYHDVSGVLLAGGKSRRMGRDKRFVKVGDSSLLERAVSIFEDLFSEVIIVVAEPAPAFPNWPHRVVHDLIPNCGSLGGLYSGLSLASNPRIFAAACDMPFLNPTVIRYMVDLDARADLVMAALADGLQPMHAVYSKSCLASLKQMIEKGNLKIQDLAGADHLSIRLVQEEEIRSIDSSLLSFLNINTPADLEFAEKALAGRRTRPTTHQ
jgi:molybdopterin-guanine dinucleotide biosynthesis protein A